MSFAEPPLIGDPDRILIQQLVRDSRTTDAREAICVLAAFLPPNKWFSRRDLEFALIDLGFAPTDIGTALDSLRSNFVLDSQVSGSRHIFRLNIKARAARQASPEPERVAVSTQLKDLRTRLRTPEQVVYFDETIKCLEVEARRAAIVMAWNLAYDHLKRWVVNDPGRLVRFNCALGPNTPPVAAYDDFPPKEFYVLDVLRAAGLITERERDTLRTHLHTRNQAAHPTSQSFVQAEVSGYVATLIRQFVENPAFG